MFNIHKTSQELETMLHDLIVKHGLFVPISKTVFRYKEYIIEKNKDGSWDIFKVTSYKQHIANTFLKVSAFAVCKLHEKRKALTVEEILREDKEFEKNYLDSICYKNTLKKSPDSISKDTALWRYEIVHNNARLAKERIDRQFYAIVT
jgi:hypothetical protein